MLPFMLLCGLWKLVACQDDGDIVDSACGESQVDQCLAGQPGRACVVERGSDGFSSYHFR